MNQADFLMDIQGVKKYFYPSRITYWRKPDPVRAVDRVSLKIVSGKTLGLVGESGCGKSTLAKMIMGIEVPTEGKVFFAGKDMGLLSRAEKKDFRHKVQMVFQDPYASLNPRQSAGKTIAEPLVLQKKHPPHVIREQVAWLMRQVGLTDDHAHRYPHEFSGGQRQRIGIARAIALRPRLIVADEPVSSLDVSIQAQILNLLKDLQEELRLTYLFISHNLAVIRYMSDYVAVMHLGRIVESGTREAIFNYPCHPYTKLLMASVLDPYMTKVKSGDLKVKEREGIFHREVCRFYPRCSEADEVCRNEEEPELAQLTDDHSVACHRVNIRTGEWK